MTVATKTPRTARKTAVKAETPAAPVQAQPAPAKPAAKSHRRLVTEAVEAWSAENKQSLTIVAHLSGTATAGSVWSVKTAAGETKRATFTPNRGHLVLAGFEQSNGKSTRAQVVTALAQHGAYELLQHSAGSVWTAKDAEDKLWLFDVKANTLVEKPAKKAPAAQA